MLCGALRKLNSPCLSSKMTCHPDFFLLDMHLGVDAHVEVMVSNTKRVICSQRSVETIPKIQGRFSGTPA